MPLPAHVHNHTHKKTPHHPKKKKKKGCLKTLWVHSLLTRVQKSFEMLKQTNFICGANFKFVSDPTKKDPKATKMSNSRSA